MRKLILIVGLFVVSCQEENVQPAECNCLKYNQQMGAGGYWYDIDSEPYPQGECADDSTIVNETMMTRYIIRCQ